LAGFSHREKKAQGWSFWSTAALWDITARTSGASTSTTNWQFSSGTWRTKAEGNLEDEVQGELGLEVLESRLGRRSPTEGHKLQEGSFRD